MENAKDNNAFQAVFKTRDELVPSTEASLRRALVVWISYVIAPYKRLQLEISDVQDWTEVREMLSTRIKQWEQDSIEKGIEKGRKEGKASMLSKALVLKFGAIPEWAERKISQADAVAMEQWFANLLSVDILEDVFK